MTRKNPFKEYEDLGKEKVRHGLASGAYGRPDSKMYHDASGWLSILDKQQEGVLTERREAREDRNLAISEEALRISRRSNKIAISAIVLSIATAIAVTIIQFVSKGTP